MLQKPTAPAAIGAERTDVLLNAAIASGCLDNAAAAILLMGPKALGDHEYGRKKASAKLSALVDSGLLHRIPAPPPERGKARWATAAFYCTPAGAERVGRLDAERSIPDTWKTTTEHTLLALRIGLVARCFAGMQVDASWTEREVLQRLGPTKGHEKASDAVLVSDGRLILVEVEHSRRSSRSLATFAKWLKKVTPREIQNRLELGVETREINNYPVSAVWIVLAGGCTEQEILRALARYCAAEYSDKQFAVRAFKLACTGLRFVDASTAPPYFALPPEPVSAPAIAAAWEAATKKKPTAKSATTPAAPKDHSEEIEALRREISFLASRVDGLAAERTDAVSRLIETTDRLDAMRAERDTARAERDAALSDLAAERTKDRERDDVVSVAVASALQSEINRRDRIIADLESRLAGSTQDTKKRSWF